MLQSPEERHLVDDFGIGVTVHTGMAKVGFFSSERALGGLFGLPNEDDHLTYTAIGQNVNLTCRLNTSKIVPKNTLVITDYAYRLIKDDPVYNRKYNFEPLLDAANSLKGFPKIYAVYSVTLCKPESDG